MTTAQLSSCLALLAPGVSFSIAEPTPGAAVIAAWPSGGPAQPTAAQLAAALVTVNQNALLGALATARWAFTQTPFTYNGNTFDGDDQSVARIGQMLDGFADGLFTGSQPWKDAMNAFQSLGQPDFLALYNALVTRRQTAYAAEAAYQAQVKAGTVTNPSTGWNFTTVPG
jgi:hypothetical protein